MTKKPNLKISIFEEYYSNIPFVDRYKKDKKDAVDIIIPIIHTNELWEANLKSLYREVPVNRLLIGDGGCIDDSIKVAKKFPRVKVLDQKKFKSLGYSIRKLIEEVETEWFIYPHSDVYLPSGWFEKMKHHQSKYDWFGCPMEMTLMVQYSNVDKINGKNRPYAGSQMGRKIAFEEGIKRIDDDYVYRQEDFIFADIVEGAGYKVGAIEDTFHYHQLIRKPSPFERKITSVSVKVETSREENIRAGVMQIKGIVKYLKPSSLLSFVVVNELVNLTEMKAINLSEFRSFVKEANPGWMKYLGKSKISIILIAYKLRKYLIKSSNVK